MRFITFFAMRGARTIFPIMIRTETIGTPSLILNSNEPIILRFFQKEGAIINVMITLTQPACFLEFVMRA